MTRAAIVSGVEVPVDHWIGGERIPSTAVFEDVSPIDESLIAEVARGGASEAEAGVTAAKDAFRGWGATSSEARAKYLHLIADGIEARLEELAMVETVDNGALLRSHRRSVMPRVAHNFRFFADWLLSLHHDDFKTRGHLNRVSWDPSGVAVLITPWNAPLMLATWKVAPALAAGSTVVLKPAEWAPLTASLLADIAREAALPDGVLNVVHGIGDEIGPALTGHRDVARISFTGSVETGRAVARKAVERMAKVQLEMGGKNPLVILDDADLAVAVNSATQGAYFSTGQRCTASSRFIVTAGIHDRFVAATIERLKALKVDDALKEGTDIGPVVDQTQLDQDLAYIEVGKKEGAKLAWGGERVPHQQQGFYLCPALFTDSTNDMRISREEIFGPVANVIRVRDYEEALSVANDTPFGLSSGIVTTSLKHASHFKRNSQAGMVMVNLPTAGVDYHVPFGGRKGSSYGPREQGRYAAEFYTIVKTSYTAP